MKVDYTCTPAQSDNPLIRMPLRSLYSKISIGLCAFFLLLGAVAEAQILLPPRYHQDTLSLNYFEGTMDANGNLFSQFCGGHSRLPKGIQVPNNQRHLYTFLYGAHFVFAGHKGSGLNVAYKEFHYFSTISPGPYSNQSNGNPANWNKTWKLNRHEVENHIQNYNQSGYVIPQNIASWPAHGDTSLGMSYQLAPFFDKNQNGQYEPQMGDFPCMPGSQAIFSVSSDGPMDSYSVSGPSPFIPSTSELGIEIQNYLYSFSPGYFNGQLDSVVFLRMTVINRSNEPITDFMAGLWHQSLIGDPNSQFMEYDIQRNMQMHYNGPKDTNYFTPNTFAGAIMMVKGPEAPPNNGIDDNLNGQVDEANEDQRFGHAMRYFQTGYTSEPVFDIDYYHYMTGKWRDSTLWQYGGTGYYGGTNPPYMAKHFFPGNTHPQWGVPWYDDTLNAFPGYRRGFLSVGPMDLQPNERKTFHLAFFFTWPQSGNNKAGLNQLRNTSDAIRSWWDNEGQYMNCATVLSDEEIVVQEALIFPNPANEIVQVQLPLTIHSIDWEIIDLLGRKVLEGKSLLSNFTIDLSGLSSGTYLVQMLSGESRFRNRLIISK